MNIITLKVPRVFTQFTDGKIIVELKAHSTMNALLQLVEIYPELKSHVFTDKQQLQSHLCLFLNNEQVMHDTPVREKDIIKIIPAMIGG